MDANFCHLALPAPANVPFEMISAITRPRLEAFLIETGWEKRIPAEEPEMQLQLFRRMQQALGTPPVHTGKIPWPTWAT